MRVVFYTNNISPHQLPLAREVMRRVGRENFLYVGDEIAWRGQVIDVGEVRTCAADDPCAREWLENADVLYTGGLRPIDLLERRAGRKLKSFYYSERWFKPVVVARCWLLVVSVPGWVRMLVPGYRRMAKRFVKWVNENSCVKFLPIGPWAAVDFRRLGVREDRMMPWGDFVSPSVGGSSRKGGCSLKVLWAGRELQWKRVRDIEKAVAMVNKKAKTSVDGGQRTICFTKLTGVTMAEVRKAMREHDVYVLASDATEGWGCVVNEALEEGMRVLGTFEAGASAAMLPKERLYHAGDVKALARLLELEAQGGGSLPPCSIGEWTAQAAATRLLKEIGYAIN